MEIIWLMPIGLLVGIIGTIIGAGGGFILIPLLLLLYPDKSPETITSISLAVVFFNALSGSIAYSKLKRIDYKSGLIFAIAGIPGSILGIYANSHISRSFFNLIFGILLITVSLYLFFRKKPVSVSEIRHGKYHILRSIRDSEGNIHEYSYNPVLGAAISLVIGFISSIMGIGGGIIHVPVLINVLSFPVHLATATSHFVLMFMSLTGSTIHLINGTLSKGVYETIALSAGVIFGAQFGAKLSKRIKGVIIVRSLAAALIFVGIRILIMAF